MPKQTRWFGTLAAVAVVATAMTGVDVALAQSSDGPPASSARRIVIDPVTKRIRGPENDDPDVAARSPRLQSRTTGASPEQVVQRMLPSAGRRIDVKNGAIGRVVDPQLLQYSVVRINRDGTRDQTCVTGADDARAFMADQRIAATHRAGGAHDE